MLINVNKILDEFSKLVKEKKYDRIEYDVWRKLSKDYEADITYRFGDYGTALHWEGKTTGYKKIFSLTEKSFGKYLWDEVIFKKPKLNLNVDTTALNTTVKKANDAFASLATAISSIDTTAIADDWSQAVNTVTADYYTNASGTGLTISDQYDDWYTVSDSTDYINRTAPNLHISQDGLYIDGRKLDDIIDEATGASVKRKEKDTMDLFKGFEFGSCENDNVKVSMYGIAVKNATGTWVSYDPNSGKVIDVDILNFNGKYLYKMPVAIKDITVGDVIIHNRKPMFVNAVEGGKLLVIDPAAGEEKIVLPTTNMFGFNFAVKIVNLFGNCFGSASADQPFGNMLPLMMFADGGKADDVLPLMFLMNGGNLDMSNPMMLYFLMKDSKNSDMLPLMFFANETGTAFGKHECHCNCNQENK